MNINRVEKPTFDVTMSMTQEEIDALSSYMQNYLHEDEDDEDEIEEALPTRDALGAKLYATLRSTFREYQTGPVRKKGFRQ